MVKIRLLIEPKRSGAFNMARDFFFLKELDEDPSLDGIFTIYTFDSPCISFGRFQELGSLGEKAKSLGLDVVRRPTGGRAVLHGERDIVYSLVLAAKHGFKPKEVRSTYEALKPIFRSFLCKLSLKIQETVPSLDLEEGTDKNLCFLSSNQSDITLNGKKVFGNALTWLKNAFLLQGTVHFEINNQLAVAMFGEKTAEKLRKNTLCLKDAGAELKLEEAAYIFSLALEENGYKAETYLLSKRTEELVMSKIHYFAV